MPKYKYKGKKKITLGWSQYQPGSTIELESLSGLKTRDFELIEENVKNTKKGGK